MGVNKALSTPRMRNPSNEDICVTINVNNAIRMVDCIRKGFLLPIASEKELHMILVKIPIITGTAIIIPTCARGIPHLTR